jgi:WD40 repeat protein
MNRELIFDPINIDYKYAITVTVTPDSTRLISYSVGTGKIKVWDLNTYKELMEKDLGNDEIQGLIITQDSRRLICYCSSLQIKVFDLKNGQVSGEFEGPPRDDYTTSGGYGLVSLLAPHGWCRHHIDTMLAAQVKSMSW